jgi:hypothetical protein
VLHIVVGCSLFRPVVFVGVMSLTIFLSQLIECQICLNIEMPTNTSFAPTKIKRPVEMILERTHHPQRFGGKGRLYVAS